MRTGAKVVPFVMAVLSIVSGPLLAEPSSDGSRFEDTRTQLISYFQDIGANSPTVLGALQRSPETMEAIHERIEAMSDEELAEIQGMMADMPSWRLAPEALVESLPLEMRRQLKNAGTYYSSRASDVKEMRDDAFTLITIAKILPESELGKLGIDSESVTSLEKALESLDPLQSAILEERLAKEADWVTARQAAMSTIPAEVQRGAAALAAHGELTDEDLSSLDEFRAEVLALFQRIEKLPTAYREQLRAEAITTLRGQIADATPEMLFMIRSQLSTEQIETLAGSIDLLERAASLTDDDVADLEQFRERLRASIAKADSDLGEKIDELRPEQLLVMNDALDAYPEWESVLPAVTSTLHDPQSERIVSVAAEAKAGSPEAAALESFRHEAILYLRSLEGAPGVSREQTDRAIGVLEDASLPHLALIREAAARMPSTASAAAMVSLPPVTTASLDLNCQVGLPSFKVAGTRISLGSINLDFICNPIEDAVNAVSAVVDDVLSVANNIWNFVKTIPSLAANQIKKVFDLLLDIKINGVSLRSLLTQGVDSAISAMKSALGLAGPWWNKVQGLTLPEIPCPPRNTWTPFGPTGSSDALRNYSKYKFILDALIDMIPDTEVSLGVKIGAKTLYAGFDYLGVCLENEAAAVDEEVNDSRWSTSVNNQGAILAAIANSGQAIQLDIANASALNLRLFIETTLQSGEGSELALLQLPSPWGHLELVHDVVRDSIDAMRAVGEKTGQAEKFFRNGEDLYRSGNFKNAFEQFQKAYRELTR